MHVLQGIIGGEGVTIPEGMKVAVFDREEGIWGFNRFAAVGESLDKNQLGLVMPGELPSAADQYIAPPSTNPILFSNPPPRRTRSFRDALDGKYDHEEVAKAALAASVLNAEEVKGDVLRYIAGLQDGKDEPYLVIVEDHKYGLGEASMGKTFVSVPKAIHSQAVAVLRDAYIKILHIMLDHAAEQIIGKSDA